MKSIEFLKQIEYVNGPYVSSKNKGRKFISMKMVDGSKRFVSYPKFLVEALLGRILHPANETIDHINGDFHNNSWENLRIIDYPTHAKQDKSRQEKALVYCIWCGASLYRLPKLLKAARRRNHAGPFCSKRCSGKYSSDLMYGRSDRLDLTKIPKDVKYIKPIKSEYSTVLALAQKQGVDVLSEAEILAALPRHRRKEQEKRNCEVCSNPVRWASAKYCSPECGHKASRKIAWPSKAVLQELVWTYPMSRIAEQLGISGTAVAKWCKKFSITKPPCGYWLRSSTKKNSDARESPLTEKTIA